jgi:hypothetical protein
MGRKLTAIYDGQVLRPDGEPGLEPNARYVITVERAQPSSEGTDAWDVLEKHAGTIDAPEDWSAEHDHYLYGTEKRAQTTTGSTHLGSATGERDER